MTYPSRPSPASSSLARLKTISLIFMLPGLAGLIISAMVSGYYLETMPQWPVPSRQQIVPRNIHGSIVYQTPAENRQLDWMEYSSVGVFLVGLGLGLTYLEKWGARQPLTAKEDDFLATE